MSERSESIERSLGHGMVASGDCIARYVVVESDSPLLSKESPVGRLDYSTVVVSAGLPTKPESSKPDLPTQSEAVRRLLDMERVAQGLEPLGILPRYLTEKDLAA